MAGTRSALIVAAYEFQDEKFRRLRAPAQDAEALAGVLGDDDVGGFDVKTLVNQPCDVVAQELEAFCSDRTPDDLLLLYFSCHGIKDAAGRLYFAMANTRFDRLRSTGVSASFVSEQMEYSRSRRIALLLDCCYSGAFLKGLRARADEGVQVQDHFEGRGRAVITASRATEYAFEGDELSVGQAQPSLFTSAIVRGLATGKADRDGDGRITIDELYDYVYDEVRGKVAGQTPGRWVDVEGELVVARNPHPPVVPAELPLELLNAVHSESAPHRIGAVTLLAGWLERGAPAEVLTARTEITRLAEDPDVRVKKAATEVLARSTTPARPADATAPPASPAVATPPPASPAMRPPAAVASPPVAQMAPSRREVAPAVASPPAIHPPAQTPVTPEGGGTVVDVPVVDVPVVDVPVVDVPVVGVTAFPTACLLGAVLLLFALFTPLADGHEGLLSDPLRNLGLATAVAVALTAAMILRGPGDRRRGLALLVGAMPAIALGSIAWTATLVKDRPEVAAGSVLLYAGSALLVFAGGRAFGRLRRSVGFLDEPTDADVVLAVVSGLLGLCAGLAYGYAVTGEWYGTGFSTLVVRLVLLSSVVVALRYWAAGSRLLPPKAARPVAAILSVGAVAAFVGGSVSSEPADNVVLGVGVVAALSSAVIPLVSALLDGRRLGAAMLVAWAATSGTLIIGQPLLSLPYLAAIAVAVILWRRAGEGDVGIAALPSRRQ